MTTSTAPVTPAPQPAPQSEPISSSAPAKQPVEQEIQQAVVGEIISISGTAAQVLMAGPGQHALENTEIRPYVGTVVAVDTGAAIVLCLITAMKVDSAETDSGLPGRRLMDVELMGELPRQEDGYLCTFRRGVSIYPRLGDQVFTPTHMVLEKAYYFGSFDAVEVGRIHQDPSIPAVIKINEMLDKHFAILGSTGTGKSCAVALILREFLAKQPLSHIVLVDPHNEYDCCFGEQANIINLDNLRLPFWFLNFEEIIEILLGGREGNSIEVELLRDFIPAAKRQFSANSGRESRLLQRSVTRKERYSVDVPVPYRISDLLGQIREQMGRLEIQKDLQPLKHLANRIEAIAQDPRYSFMFGKKMVEDNLGDILKQIFRIPVNNKPITIIQLVGLPTEIVNVIVSVLARLAFDLALWSNGKVPITFVCEEAHRYVPRDKNTGFEPTKSIISRIAKEGRKYGISLCIVSQRPGDIDPTILSQCSTIFAMRLSNERDQRIVKSAVSDAAESLLRFLPSLGMRETIAFGEGVTLPSRIMLSKLPESALPQGATGHMDIETQELNPDLVDDAILRWRSVGSDIISLLPDGTEVTADPGPPAAAPQHGNAAAPNGAGAQPQPAPPPAQAPAPNGGRLAQPAPQPAQPARPAPAVSAAPQVQPAPVSAAPAQPQPPAQPQFGRAAPATPQS